MCQFFRRPKSLKRLLQVRSLKHVTWGLFQKVADVDEWTIALLDEKHEAVVIGAEGDIYWFLEAMAPYRRGKSGLRIPNVDRVAARFLTQAIGVIPARSRNPS